MLNHFISLLPTTPQTNGSGGHDPKYQQFVFHREGKKMSEAYGGLTGQLVVVWKWLGGDWSLTPGAMGALMKSFEVANIHTIYLPP